MSRAIERVVDLVSDAAHDAGWTEPVEYGVTWEEPFVSVTVARIAHRTTEYGHVYPEHYEARVCDMRLKVVASATGETSAEALRALDLHMREAYALERAARAAGCRMFSA